MEYIKEDKRAVAVEQYRNYHQDLINDLGIPRSDFNIKRAFYDRQGRLVVGIFDSEFIREKGYFIELTKGANNEPLNKERTVYRIPNNPYFDQEYELGERNSYLVPVEELQPVNKRSVAISGSSAIINTPASANAAPTKVFAGTTEVTQLSGTPATPRFFSTGDMGINTTSDLEDAPYSAMTIRDYYAMLSGKPVSNKAWLNQLIKLKQ
jgi:hypothetical protein